MKLRATSVLLEGWEGEARITTEHSASSYGIPVLLIEGEPVGTAEAALAGYEILEATEEEGEMLERAGYSLPDADVEEE
jgi:hypothetical protein